MEVAKYLLDQEGVHYLFSERFNQDPLEAYFGKQRAHGGRCENPSVQQFVKNSVSLRVQKSAAPTPVRGNTCQKTRAQISVSDAPLPKRRRIAKE